MSAGSIVKIQLQTMLPLKGSRGELKLYLLRSGAQFLPEQPQAKDEISPCLRFGARHVIKCEQVTKHFMILDANKRIAAIAGVTVFLDHLTKLIVLRYLDYANEKVIIPGFFKFVHWGNTGAAWSMFNGNNNILAIISLVAVVVLFVFRSHFDTRSMLGQVSMGLIFGGIIGNMIDRIFRGHVIDFIYFYLQPRGGHEVGFPAFNIADTAICTGVGLLLLISWRQEMQGDRSAKVGEA
jgi:signal peptidase II